VAVVPDLRHAPILLAIAIGIASSPARAQPSVDASKCADGDFMGIELALEHCNRAIASGKLTGKELARMHYNRAATWTRKQERFRALADLGEAIRIDPAEAVNFRARGVIHLARQDYSQACTDLDEAIRLNPRFAEAFVARGRAWLARDDIGKAIADFEQTLALPPTDDAGAYVGAGLAYTGRRRYYDRNSMDSMAYLGRSAAHALNKDSDRSSADLIAWIRLHPKRDGPAAFRARAALWLEMNAFEFAITDYGRAISMNAEDRFSLASRGLASMLTNDYAAAIADFSAAIRLDQTDYRPLRLRGYARYFNAEYAAAGADLGEANRLESGDPYVMAWLFLAQARSAPAESAKWRAELAERSERLRKGLWPYPVIALLLGEATPEEVLGAIKTADDKLKRAQTCEAQYFIAQSHLLASRLLPARELLRSAEQTCPRSHFEHPGALAELSRLPK
jgi:lipoprotein NlpI